MLQMVRLRIFSLPASWLSHVHSFLFISFSLVRCVLGSTLGFHLKRSCSCFHSGCSLRERHIKITAKKEAEGRRRLCMYGFCLIQPQPSRIWTVMSVLENPQSIFWCVVSPQTVGRPNPENEGCIGPSKQIQAPICAL